MQINDFVANFAAQFDETEESLFTPETNFKALEEWSSLMGLSIIAMIVEEYSVTIKGDDIRNAQTIQQLFDLVVSKK